MPFLLPTKFFLFRPIFHLTAALTPYFTLMFQLFYLFAHQKSPFVSAATFSAIISIPQ